MDSKVVLDIESVRQHAKTRLEQEKTKRLGEEESCVDVRIRSMQVQP